MIPDTPKTNIDSYFDQAKPHIKTLIKKRLKEMESAKIIMTSWVIWKKLTERPLIDLYPEDLEDRTLCWDDGASDNYIRVGMPFNSLLTEFLRVVISII